MTIEAAPAMDSQSITPTSHFIQNEKLINEEFKIWKKTVPFLYDSIQTYVQETPSLSVEPLPHVEISDDKNEVVCKFLFGTYSSTGSQNFLKLGSIRLPSTISPKINNSIPIETGSSIDPKFKVIQKWNHPSEVNKARYNSKYDKIATFTKTGEIKIWDFKHDNAIDSLKFHNKDGFGLEWGTSESNSQYLLTGSEDCKIALWDINSTAKPFKTFEIHNSIVNDFSWSYGIPTLFGSVSDDLSVQFSDIRSANSNKSVINIQEAHKDVVNAIDFNSKAPTIFVTGSADNLISCWDLRNTSQPIRQLFGHNNAIGQLSFSKDSPNLLASSSSDRRIMIWDFNNFDEEFDHDDYLKNEIDDPALVFIHGGHTAKVTEFAWIPEVSNTLISAGEDNLIEIWKPHLQEEEEEEQEEEEEDENDEEGNEVEIKEEQEEGKEKEGEGKEKGEGKEVEMEE